MYEGNQIGTLDLCSLYENCIQVMIMSEKLYQNPIPEWNAAWLLGGKILCTLMSKSHLNYHFPQCIMKPQSRMVIWTIHILKKILDRFTFSEFCKHRTSIYIFRIFTKWVSQITSCSMPPPLYSVIQWLYIEALWTVKLQFLKVTKSWFQWLLGNKWRNVLSIVTIAIWEIDKHSI